MMPTRPKSLPKPWFLPPKDLPHFPRPTLPLQSPPPSSSPPPPTPALGQWVLSKLLVPLHIAPTLTPSVVVTADFKKAWLPFSSVSPLCKFMLLPTKEPGLVFQSPLPACHSQQLRPQQDPGAAVSLLAFQHHRRHKGCNIPKDQRLPCGMGALTQPQCLSMGCCFNKQPPACSYPMDACTLDRNFVFSVPAALTVPPLSLALLVAPGNTSCKPRRVIPDYALFQIPMDSCGAHSVQQSMSSLRILVECRYSPGPPVVTTGYMTKFPSLGPGHSGQGVFGVQLRIAKDAQYSNYHSQYHVPLHMLLGEPLYLELRLVNPPDLQLLLLVHYCVAYPRSGDTMWVLLYKE
ncbi:hypothetical protein CRUP_003810 [Coryphaenoides rupestris]|nr:hypothetical protein CRUP_003810 [Coryphaenoides rupestris]